MSHEILPNLGWAHSTLGRAGCPKPMLTAAPEVWGTVVMGVTPLSPRGSVHHMDLCCRGGHENWLAFHLLYKAYPLLIHGIPCKPRQMLIVSQKLLMLPSLPSLLSLLMLGRVSREEVGNSQKWIGSPLGRKPHLPSSFSLAFSKTHKAA